MFWQTRMTTVAYRQNSGAAGAMADLAAQLKSVRTNSYEHSQAPRTPRTPRNRHPGIGAWNKPPPPRRRRRQLWARLLVAALAVAALTGAASYALHDFVFNGRSKGAVRFRSHSEALVTGLQDLLGGGPPRRGLRERSAPSSSSSSQQEDSLVGIQVNSDWYFLATAGQQQRQQSPTLRLYDLQQQQWRRSNMTKFPAELPVGQWATTTLLNRAKPKESAVFLLGGAMSAAEAAARRPPRPKAPSLSAEAAAAAGKRELQPATTPICPFASTAAFSVTPGRGKHRPLPPLPQPRLAGTAVVSGARLHFFGGYSTERAIGGPQPTAVPAMEHWSIGLNADGSSAAEWQEERALPPQLAGATAAVALAPQGHDGEPAIFAWARAVPARSGSGGSSSGGSQNTGGGRGEASDSFADGGSSCGAPCNPACLAAVGSRTPAGSNQASAAGAPVQLWAYTRSGGWQQRGRMPRPLGNDVQCMVATSPHQLLAVGAVERVGLFSRQRGVWQYDSQYGGSWSRAGWAPAEFKGRHCALHDGRLFVSSALPPVPSAGTSATAAASTPRQGLAGQRPGVDFEQAAATS